MSTELVQTVIVSAIALGAAGIVLWTIARPYFTTSGTGAPCARCEAGDKCAPVPAKDQLIQIKRRTS